MREESLPFEDFLPMFSLSTTSSAQAICLSSTGSARNTRVPVRKLRTACAGCWVCVLLPVGAVECDGRAETTMSPESAAKALGKC